MTRKGQSLSDKIKSFFSGAGVTQQALPFPVNHTSQTKKNWHYGQFKVGQVTVSLCWGKKGTG